MLFAIAAFQPRVVFGIRAIITITCYKSSFYTEFEQASLLNKAHQVTHHMPFSLPADNKGYRVKLSPGRRFKLLVALLPLASCPAEERQLYIPFPRLKFPSGFQIRVIK